MHFVAPVLLIIGCFLQIAPVHAGAWLQPKGGGYLKVSYASFRSNEAFDADGNTIDLNAGGVSSGDYRDISVNTYVEYGLHERLTLVANVPVKQASKAGDRTVGIGDLTAGLRTPLFSGPVVFSLSSAVKVPLYRQSQVAGPSLGTARVDGDFRLLAGRSFWPVPAYATAEIGYRRRGGFSDQVVYSGELGGTVGGKTDIRIRLSAENSRIRPDRVVLDPANPNFGDQDFVNLGGGLAIGGDSTRLTVDVIRTLTGRNTAKGTYLGAGVSHAW